MLRWTHDAEGRPPVWGSLAGLEALAEPSPALCAEAVRLAAVQAARLRWRQPPLDDGTPPGVGGIWLAAAVGGLGTPQAALILVGLCPPPRGAWDLLLYHAVVGSAAPWLPEEVTDVLRAASPLTAVLTRPAAGHEDRTLAFVNRLRAHPDGRRSLVLALAAPTTSPDVRRWRESLLDRLRAGDEAARAFVLEVYEAALLHHGAAAREEIAQAEALFRRGGSDCAWSASPGA